MKCWVCHRQARGLGYRDTRFRIADPRRYPLDWVFCSRRCQDAFHKMYCLRIEAPSSVREAAMTDPTEMEMASLKKCLKAFGEAAGEIGFDKPLGAYSEAEALKVIEAIVTCWTETMIAHHEAASHPAVRGLASTVSDPFAELKDDLPWEK